MADLPTPAARRLRPPSWRDARLLAGLGLVLTSTVAGGLAVAHADDRTPMYVARGPLVPGQALSPDALSRVEVRLDDGVSPYLPATKELPADRVVLREVRAGELVPLSALGEVSQSRVQPLTLKVDATSAEGLTAGAVVDVYVNAPKEGNGSRTFLGPELSVSRAAVVRLADAGGGLGGGGATRSVTLSVPRDAVADLIGSADNGARITLVPTHA